MLRSVYPRKSTGQTLGGSVNLLQLCANPSRFAIVCNYVQSGMDLHMFLGQNTLTLLRFLKWHMTLSSGDTQAPLTSLPHGEQCRRLAACALSAQLPFWSFLIPAHLYLRPKHMPLSSSCGRFPWTWLSRYRSFHIISCLLNQWGKNSLLINGDGMAS